MGSNIERGDLMGVTRNGARTFLDLAVKVCKLSHLPGFRLGLRHILGNDAADELYGFWTPFCSYLESLQSLDNYFNKRDAGLPDLSGGEDTAFG
jgi:hypothetical protein